MTHLPASASRRRTAAVAVLALSLGSFLAACGSDGSEPAASEDVTTTTSPDDTVSATPDPGDATDEPDLPAEIEIADTQVLIDLAEEDAHTKAEDAGWTMRVIRRDGEDLPATNDYSPTRVNVGVEGGVVTEVLSIG